MILVVYIGHGIVHPVEAIYFSSKKFSGEVLRTQIEEAPEKKWCASTVARV